MPNVFAVAPTGRASCRACSRPIAKGEIRFAERLPNAFGEGEMSLWFHPLCAAYARPDAILAVIDQAKAHGLDEAELRRESEKSLAHRRLPRLRGAERATSARAHCRACRETIAKGDWRIRLAYYEDGRFEPSGTVHLACAPAYFGTRDLVDRLAYFSPLEPGERAEIEASLAEAPTTPS